MTQAISPRQRRRRVGDGREIVVGRLDRELARTPAGTPGEPGMPSVATPLPAPTSSPSAWPW